MVLDVFDDNLRIQHLEIKKWQNPNERLKLNSNIKLGAIRYLGVRGIIDYKLFQDSEI